MIEDIQWDASGLVPVVAQDILTGDIRMVAYANRTALSLTLERKEAYFYSRSRKEIWHKGETSGNTMQVREVWVDCDKDAVIYLVDPAGPTCHTGDETCFFTRLDSVQVDQKRAEPALARLWATLEARRTADGTKSYTKSLLDKGPARVAEKIREEGEELARAVEEEAEKRVVSESADLLYHLMVGLIVRNVAWREVIDALAKRFGISGVDEKASRFSLKP
jgi:phosphoribosyl-ATP pyrophosphohydrolase/phosphoribosyl-AMP cyclohydrolase